MSKTVLHRCPRCNEVVTKGQEFCGNCGYALVRETQMPTQRESQPTPPFSDTSSPSTQPPWTGTTQRSSGGWSPSPQPKKTNFFPIIIGVIVVVGLVGCGGWAMLQTLGRNSHQPTPTTSNPSNPFGETPTSVGTSNPTSEGTSSPTSLPQTILTPNTKNYQFICITNCDGSPGVTLNDIKINTTNQNMIWDFTIANNGQPCSISGNLSLTSPSGDTINVTGGTFNQGTALGANQILPETAIFSKEHTVHCNSPGLWLQRRYISICVIQLPIMKICYLLLFAYLS